MKSDFAVGLGFRCLMDPSSLVLRVVVVADDVEFDDFGVDSDCCWKYYYCCA